MPVFINILNQNYTIWEDNTSSIYIACIFISFLIFFTAFIVDKLLKKKHQKELISKRTKSSRIHFKIEYKNLKIAIAVIIIITSVLICAKYFVSVDRNTAHKIFEYNIIQVKGNKLPKIYTEDDKEQLLKQSDFLPLNFGDTYDIEKLLLNSYGEEGWELVDVYTTTETVYPNFGNKDYVTGLRENVRTNTVNFVFKRLKNN